MPNYNPNDYFKDLDAEVLDAANLEENRNQNENKYQEGYSLFIEYYGEDDAQRLSYDFTQGFEDFEHMDYLMKAAMRLKMRKQEVKLIKFALKKDGKDIVANYEAKRTGENSWDLYEMDHVE